MLGNPILLATLCVHMFHFAPPPEILRDLDYSVPTLVSQAPPSFEPRPPPLQPSRGSGVGSRIRFPMLLTRRVLIATHFSKADTLCCSFPTVSLSSSSLHLSSSLSLPHPSPPSPLPPPFTESLPCEGYHWWRPSDSFWSHFVFLESPPLWRGSLAASQNTGWSVYSCILQYTPVSSVLQLTPVYSCTL